MRGESNVKCGSGGWSLETGHLCVGRYGARPLSQYTISILGYCFYTTKICSRFRL